MTGTSPSNTKYSGEISARSWLALKCIAHKPVEERAQESASKKSLDNLARKTRHFSRRKSAAKNYGANMKVILTKDECEAILLAHVNQRVVTKQGFNRIEIQPGYRLTEFCTVYSNEAIDQATISSQEGEQCQA